MSLTGTANRAKRLRFAHEEHCSYVRWLMLIRPAFEIRSDSSLFSNTCPASATSTDDLVGRLTRMPVRSARRSSPMHARPACVQPGGVITRPTGKQRQPEHPLNRDA